MFVKSNRAIDPSCLKNTAVTPKIRLYDNPGNTQGSLFGGGLKRLVDEYGLVHKKYEKPVTEFDKVLQESNNLVIEISQEGEILKTNKAVYSVLAYREEDLTGSSFYSVVVPEYHGIFKRRMAMGMGSAVYKNFSTEYLLIFQGITKNKRVYPLETYFFPIYRDGEQVFLAVMRRVFRDDTLENKLVESTSNYHALSETISEGIIRLDEKLDIIFANSYVEKIFGYKPVELFGKPFEILFPEAAFERHKNDFLKYFFIDYEHRSESGLKDAVEILGKNKNRGVSLVEISFGNSRKLKERSVTCIIRDISQRKNMERKLKHLAFHDKLTGLGNRDLFTMDLAALLKKRGKTSVSGSLFFMDLDGFKQVNDTFGHDFGDQLLIHTAKRIMGSLRETDSVYRLGGDEFVILVQKIHKRNEASIIAQNVLSEVNRPFYLESLGTSTTVSIGVSIGIVLLPGDGSSISEVIKNADLAMYSAKNFGKNRYTFFNKNMTKSARERWSIEQGLRTAITNNEIFMFYQPIVDKNDMVKGVEALVRWKHPYLGYIPPDKFIPIAEETGFINVLGNWIMERVLRDLKRINDKGFSNLYVSFNLSAVQFRNQNIAETIGNVIKRTGVNVKNLRMEITETSFIKAPDAVAKVINRLKGDFPGIKFVLDDFGTGYSSLSYLSRMPIDALKIDISFVRKLFDTINLKVVTAVISLARSLDLEIIAEGIEKEEQRAFFKKEGDISLQGYLFSRAVKLDEIIKKLESGAFSS